MNNSSGGASCEAICRTKETRRSLPNFPSASDCFASASGMGFQHPTKCLPMAITLTYSNRKKGVQYSFMLVSNKGYYTTLTQAYVHDIRWLVLLFFLKCKRVSLTHVLSAEQLNVRQLSPSITLQDNKDILIKIYTRLVSGIVLEAGPRVRISRQGVKC